jgi:LacI family transcriptional regulator
MTVTLRTLAERLELSVGTISRALNPEDRTIAAQTRRRVAEAARELGYRPNLAARALVTGRRRVVGLHLGSMHSYYVATALRFQGLLAADGYSAVLSTADLRPPARLETDGDVFIGTGVPDEYLREEHPPVVTLLDHPRADFVAVDFYAPARAAVAHLIASAGRRVAMLGPRCGDARGQAYDEAIAAAGLAPELIQPADTTRAGARAALARHAALHGLPDGIFCHNDDAAIGAYRAVLDLGARVPDDVALVGCDGIDDTEFLERPLSTIVQPLDDSCRAAWEALKRRLERPEMPQQRIRLGARLVLRASTRPLPGATP